MHVTAHLDLDLVPMDEADDVTCLVQLTAPVPAATANRPGQSLVIVLDRSGSMDGPQLDGAKDAIAALIRRLAPQDCFGLVVFDDSADVVIPVRPMKDHDVPTLETLIGRIQSGGSTDLSAGYLLGLRELKRSLRATHHTGATVLLVSDGHANAGLVDPVQMRDLAGKANTRHQSPRRPSASVRATTRSCSRRSRAAATAPTPSPPTSTPPCTRSRTVVTDLLDKSVVAALMRIRPQSGLVDSVTILQDVPNWAEGDADRRQPGRPVRRRGAQDAVPPARARHARPGHSDDRRRRLRVHDAARPGRARRDASRSR